LKKSLYLTLKNLV
jgi:hypothetical protein